MTATLQPTLIYDMMGRQVCPAGFSIATRLDPYIARMESSLLVPGSTIESTIPFFSSDRTAGFNRRFGRLICPEAVGSAESPAGGAVEGAATTQWMLDTLGAGLSIWTYLAVVYPFGTAHSDLGANCPPDQNFHLTADRGIYRIRISPKNDPETSPLQTYIMNAVGGTGALDPSTIEHVSARLDNMLWQDGNLVEFLWELSPSDPDQAAFANKQNLRVALRTTDPGGAEVYALNQFAHYQGGTFAANPRNTLIPDIQLCRPTIMRSLDPRVSVGACAYPICLMRGSRDSSGGMLSNLTDIATIMDELPETTSFVEHNVRARRYRGPVLMRA